MLRNVRPQALSRRSCMPSCRCPGAASEHAPCPLASRCCRSVEPHFQGCDTDILIRGAQWCCCMPSSASAANATIPALHQCKYFSAWHPYALDFSMQFWPIMYTHACVPLAYQCDRLMHRHRRYRLGQCMRSYAFCVASMLKLAHGSSPVVLCPGSVPSILCSSVADRGSRYVLTKRTSQAPQLHGIAFCCITLLPM